AAVNIMFRSWKGRRETPCRPDSSLADAGEAPTAVVDVAVVPLEAVDVAPVDPDVLEPLDGAFLDRFGMAVREHHRGGLREAVGGMSRALPASAGACATVGVEYRAINRGAGRVDIHPIAIHGRRITRYVADGSHPHVLPIVEPGIVPILVGRAGVGAL